MDVDPSNVTNFRKVVLPAKIAYDFSSIASSADNMTQVKANFFDLMPAAQENKLKDSSRGPAEFRHYLVSMKQTVL
jgi:hypothetical protein